ncbi:hypothetical protein [Fictibacillus halophilus]|uniref:hypothetical protein n=1 Tax=Fictibacillus halophilus TaxID=1610490 RepID=UPI001CFB3E59|nr:hypothetical protein [Fictibacillus halophilus]
MKLLVERTQMKYRKIRERGNYSITDIESTLKILAWEGFVWTLKDMPDLTRSESILIDYYLTIYRENQVYEISF